MSEKLAAEYNPKGMSALQSGVVSSAGGGSITSGSAGIQTTNLQTDIQGALLVDLVGAGGVPTSSGGNPIIGASVEQVFSPTLTSAGSYGSGMCLGNPATITNGGSLRDISVDLNISTTSALSCVVLRAACGSTTTLTDHSAANIALVDAGKVLGAVTLISSIVPGGSSTNWTAVGIDMVVSSGAQIVLIVGGTMSATATTSGLTIGAGIV